MIENDAGIFEGVPARAAKRPGIVSGLRSFLFAPVLAPLLSNRLFSLLLTGIGVLQVALVTAGLPGWQCPVKAALGVPCLGCGLSTAMALLLRGRWYDALSTHAFAPFFLFGFILMAVVGVLPERLRVSTIDRVASLERRTGLVAFLLLGLVAYWVVRLAWLFS